MGVGIPFYSVRYRSIFNAMHRYIRYILRFHNIFRSVFLLFYFSLFRSNADGRLSINCSTHFYSDLSFPIVCTLSSFVNVLGTQLDTLSVNLLRIAQPISMFLLLGPLVSGFVSSFDSNQTLQTLICKVSAS